MAKKVKKEYKSKVIDIDLQFEILDRLTDEGEKPKPSTMLWVVRQTMDISEEELNEIGAIGIGQLAGEVLQTLTDGKKK